MRNIHALLLFSLALDASARSFPCPVVAGAKASPANVTELHPSHVSVIMAMGDSITAAFAAKPFASTSGKLSHPMLPLEYRGLSFSGGVGSADDWTLPYFLSQYNHSLTGFSNHDTVPQTPGIGYLDESGNALNVALSNAHSWQLETEVEELVKETKPIEDFDNRWKILTILIGANDLCDGNTADFGGGFAGCDGSSRNRTALADRYEQKLRGVLTKVRDSFKHIVVQLVSMFSLKSVYQIRHGNWWCDAIGITRKAIGECNCLDKSITGSGNPSDDQLNNLDATVADFNRRLHTLADEFNLQRPDFAVISQSGVAGQSLPDKSFLSNLDCFHPSAKAHGVVATALWNGLFDDTRSPKPLDADVQPFCPTADSVISVGQKKQTTQTPFEQYVV